MKKQPHSPPCGGGNLTKELLLHVTGAGAPDQLNT